MQLKDYIGATDKNYLNLLATLATIKTNSTRVLNELQELDKRIGADDFELLPEEIAAGEPLTKTDFQVLKNEYKDTGDLMLRNLLDATERAFTADFKLESLAAIAQEIKTNHPPTTDQTVGACGNCGNWRLLPYFDTDNPNSVRGECQVLKVEGKHLRTSPDFACQKWRTLENA